MLWQFNPYVFALIINTVLAASLFVYTWKLKNLAGSRYFALFLLGCAIWDFSAIFELSSTVLTTKILFSKIEYLGAVSVANFWFFFAASFSKKYRIKRKQLYILFWIIPVIVLIMAWTNEMHRLIWTNVYLTDSPYGIIAIYVHGIFFYVNVVYSYILLFLGTVIMIKEAFTFPKIYRNQSLILILAVCIPWFGDILYVLGISPIHGLDSGTFALTISAILIVFGYLRFRLFSISPIAHEIIFSNIAEGIIVVDEGYRIVQMNQSAKSLFELKINTGDNIRKFLMKYFKDIQLDKLDIEQEQSISDCNGIFWLGIRISSIKNFRDEYLGKIFIFNDITERKKSEETLKKSEMNLREMNEIKNRFFSILSHDLRNPFGSVLGYSEILKEDYKDLTDEEKIDFIEQINISSNNIYRLLEDLLEWSKLNMDTLEPELEKLNLFNEVEETILLLKNLAAKKLVTIKNEVNPQFTISSDPSMVQLLLRNLISNAIKFSPSESTIRVCLKEKQNDVEISVIDNGVGILPEAIPILFRPDIKYSTEGTDKEKGTGLGLVLCKEIAEKLKGKIAVESQPGKGSTFTFTLPKI